MKLYISYFNFIKDMITIQTLTESFEIPYSTEDPYGSITKTIYQYNPEFHIDFQNLVNLRTGLVLYKNNLNDIKENDIIGLVMLNEINVEIEEEMPIGGETLFTIRWTPSHIQYGESHDAQLGYDDRTGYELGYDYVSFLYDIWDPTFPHFDDLGNKKYAYPQLYLMLDQIVKCNWPITQRSRLIQKIVDLVYTRISNGMNEE